MQRLLKIFRVLLWLTVVGVVLGIAGVVGIYYHFGKDLPKDLTKIHHYNPPRTTEIYAAGGELIGEFYLERRIVVPLERIPDHMLQAIISAEDQRFFSHPGVDPIGTVRALVSNFIGSGIKQGASGLTQQLARGFFLTPERNYTRKIKEAILSFRIEHELSKDQILELYLNHVYLGHGAYGVQAASELYFGKNVEDLSLGEAAVLAGLPQAPSRYSPYIAYESARARQAYVLGRMVTLRFITRKQADDAIASPLVIVAKPDPNLRFAPYFVSEIREQLIRQFGWERVYGGGLKVYTTVDLKAQQAAQQSVRHGLVGVDRRYGWRGPVGEVGDLGVAAERERFKAELAHNKQGITVAGTYTGVVSWAGQKKEDVYVALGDMELNLDAEDVAWAMRLKLAPDGHHIRGAAKVTDAFRRGDLVPVKVKTLPGTDQGGVATLDYVPEVEGALVALDAETGEVKALVGGYDYARSEFNRATQGLRQPGSSFKPIVYSAALDKGYTPETIVHDSPISFQMANGTTWSPENYGGKYYGAIPLREALAKSLNTIAVRLVVDVGVPTITEYARRFGITSQLPADLSISLGSADVTVLEMAAAYSVFPRMGRRAVPVFIRKIEDDRGRVIWENPGQPKKPQADPFAPRREDPLQALTPATAYLMVDMMKGVIDHGTATGAKKLGRPAGGKTGTTNQSRNVWFIGYTADLVCAVWVGFDVNRPVGRAETGGRAAVPIWLWLMEVAEEGKPVRDFEVPPGVVFARGNDGTYLPARRDPPPLLSREQAKSVAGTELAPAVAQQAPKLTGARTAKAAKKSRRG
jgi:penicillin-binding protein 1A